MISDTHKAHNYDRLFFISSMNYRHVIIFAMLLVLFISACSLNVRSKPGDAWDYADLLGLTSHSNADPELDFIAVYSRFTNSDLQIRLDLLDIQFDTSTDIYIAIDTSPGGTHALPIDGEADIEWDTLLVLPTSGIPYGLSPIIGKSYLEANENIPEFMVINDLIPRIIRIPWHDYIIISINRAKLPDYKYGFTFQVFSTQEDSKVIADEIGPMSLDTSPPSRAPVLLAFWNTFPTYTPAQSLRRWDGAHTGPHGERHGLSILLNNVKKFRVPVMLLDLRNPTSLSALDYSGGVSLVQTLVANKLLILPDLVPGSPTFPIYPIGLPDWVTTQFLHELKVTSEEFSLPSSQILYSPVVLDRPKLNYSIVLTTLDLSDQTRIANNIMPIPHEISLEPQATKDGLSIPIRKSLIDNALSINQGSDQKTMLILGGSLLQSSFADPQASEASLSYIASHPWIDPQDEMELITSIGKTIHRILPGETNPVTAAQFSPSEILSKIITPSHFPNNPLYLAAWQAAISLFEPLPPEAQNLSELRSLYSGQPGILLTAADWAQNPQARLDCLQDLDLDGLPECVLASTQIFSVMDIKGGRLIAMFIISETGIHQIIGTNSQFIVGMTEPSAWNLSAGEGADRNGLHGGFIDHPPPWEIYEVSPTKESLTFSSPDLRITKKFSLSPTGLRIDYRNEDTVTTDLSLVVDPWNRFTSDWSNAYHGHTIPNGFRWSYEDEITIEIISNASFDIHDFKSSLKEFAQPEDPNLNYPQGHYLPFPFLVLKFKNVENFFVEINSLYRP